MNTYCLKILFGNVFGNVFYITSQPIDFHLKRASIETKSDANAIAIAA